MKSDSPQREKSLSVARGVAAFFGLKRHKKAKPKDRAAKSAAGKFNPSVSHTLADVVAELQASQARKLGIHGDATFFATMRQQVPQADLVWLSADYREIEAGAAIADQADLAEFDALVCGGSDVAMRWRHALHLALRANPAMPIHWIGEQWEFCSGMLPVPMDADDAEALLFNHFEQFFGIRDPLLFRVTIYHGPEEKHFYRVLEPNQSILLKLSDFFPQRRYTAAFSARVENPVLTRGRHYRMRLCADVFWRGSLTTLHSAHEFNRDPQRGDEFRLSSGLLRRGDLIVTIPNYDRNQIAGSMIEMQAGANETSEPRDLSAYLQEVRLSQTGAVEHQQYGWRYKGYGGSFWFALDQQAGGGSISANHHISVPWMDRPGMELPASEAARIKQLLDASYMIDPHPVPLTQAGDPVHFGFDCDSANPHSDHFLIYLFDAAGKHLATLPYRKTHWGPSFPEHFLAAADPAKVAAARLAMVSPDWLKNGYTRNRYKLQADLVAENRRTGDRDVTEFQSSWRNLGVAIQDFPHWLSPANSIIGRSNLMGRVRHGGGYRTGLLIVNGSGSLRYQKTARVKVVALNLAGEQREGNFDIAALTGRIVWADEVIPDLQHLLGSSSVGGLLVKSADADLNCQLLTTTEGGAVSLQHLWGY